MTFIYEVPLANEGTFSTPHRSPGIVREDADYTGVPIEFVTPRHARVHMHIDIGFGDVMTPGPETFTYPTVLGFPAPVPSGFIREIVVAEKLQALVQLCMLNTRMKDYFDLWPSTREPKLDEAVLTTAVHGRSRIGKWRLIPPCRPVSGFGVDPIK